MLIAFTSLCLILLVKHENIISYIISYNALDGATQDTFIYTFIPGIKKRNICEKNIRILLNIRQVKMLLVTYLGTVCLHLCNNYKY